MPLVSEIVPTKNSSEFLEASLQVPLTDPVMYERMRENAWQWSKEITFDKSYEQFLTVIKNI